MGSNGAMKLRKLIKDQVRAMSDGGIQRAQRTEAGTARARAKGRTEARRAAEMNAGPDSLPSVVRSNSSPAVQSDSWSDFWPGRDFKLTFGIHRGLTLGKLAGRPNGMQYIAWLAEHSTAVHARTASAKFLAHRQWLEAEAAPPEPAAPPQPPFPSLVADR